MTGKKENVRAVSLQFILVLTLFVAALLVFGYLVDEVVLEKEKLFDDTVFHFFDQFKTPAFINVASKITFFGSAYFFFPAYTLLIIYFLIRRKRAYALDIALVGISSTLLMTTLKHIFHRPRPEHSVFKQLTNYSFPSGHALSSFIFCSVLIYITWNGKLKTGWKWLLSILFFLFAVCIGISRIVLRYHYASDVLAGMCLGFAWAMLSLWLLKKFRRQTKQPEQQAVSHPT